MQKIPWENSVWFFDVDDTLINTAETHPEAAKSLCAVCTHHFGEKAAQKIQKEFNAIYDLMLAGYRVNNEEDWNKIPGGKPALESLLSTISSYQTQIIKKYGSPKKWSREIFLKIAADRTHVAITSEIIEEATDAYWHTMAEKATFLPGAKECLQIINSHKRPIFLVTGSDARFEMENDGQFSYDPARSETKKRKRVESLKNKGISFRSISIGDPIDKPHIEYFEKAIKTAEQNLNTDLNLDHCIIVGDSYAGDLEVPKDKLHFGLAILYKQNQTETNQEASNLLTAGNLSTITKLF